MSSAICFNLDQSKMLSSDNGLNEVLLKGFLMEAENVVGKGENAGVQHFLPFPQCCQKLS